MVRVYCVWFRIIIFQLVHFIFQIDLSVRIEERRTESDIPVIGKSGFVLISEDGSGRITFAAGSPPKAVFVAINPKLRVAVRLAFVQALMFGNSI